MIGDLNNSPYSSSFKCFIQSTGLKDTRLGQGWHPSWPSVFPLLWIPIDHVLVSPSFQVLHYQTGSYIGSDHFPVMVEVGLPPSGIH